MKRLALDEVIEAMRGRAGRQSTPVTVSGVCTDSRRTKTGDLFVAIQGENFDGHDYVPDALRAGAIAAVVSRDIPASDLPGQGIIVRVDDTVRALGRLGRFHRRQLSLQVIAVTGSNGKTSTKMMIDHVLAGKMTGRASLKSFNNAIGVPLTLLAAEAADEYLVVEIGSNAPGEVAALADMARPEIGVITGASASHLAGLGTLDGVVVEKLSLLKHIRAGGLAIVNTDPDPIRKVLSRESERKTGGPRLLTYGTRDQADLRLTSVVPEEDGIVFRINGRLDVRLPVLGRHNAVNALAAVAVGRRMGMTHEELADRLSTFRLPPMRLEHVPCGQITVINDAYNANPASMRLALQTLAEYPAAGRKICALGDMLELGERAEHYHQALGEQAARSGIDLLVCVGSFAQVVARAARQTRPTLETRCHRKLGPAGRTVSRFVRPGDVVLVKGSRSMRMEHVVETLIKAAAAKSSVAA